MLGNRFLLQITLASGSFANDDYACGYVRVDVQSRFGMGLPRIVR